MFVLKEMKLFDVQYEYPTSKATSCPCELVNLGDKTQGGGSLRGDSAETGGEPASLKASHVTSLGTGLPLRTQ